MPYAQSVALHRALDRTTTRNELVRIPGAGHGDFTPAQVEHAYSAVLRFLRANGLGH